MNPTADRLLARLRFRHLQLVAEVERLGTLGKAALALNLTQPALSKALKEIEELLGFALFNRGARGLQPTPQGRIVMRGATLLLNELRHFHAEAVLAGPEGRFAATLRLGAPAFLAVSLLPAVVTRLATSAPPIVVSLYEASVPRLFEMLIGGALDALVTVYNPEAMAATAGHDIRFDALGREDYTVIAPAAHPLTRARGVAWAALLEQPWVLTRKPSLARVFIEDTFRLHGLTPPVPICETDSPVTSARLVEEGAGFSVTPVSTALEAERRGGARRVAMASPPPGATIGLVHRTAAADHPRIAALRRVLEGMQTTADAQLASPPARKARRAASPRVAKAGNFSQPARS